MTSSRCLAIASCIVALLVLGSVPTIASGSVTVVNPSPHPIYIQAGISHGFQLRTQSPCPDNNTFWGRGYRINGGGRELLTNCSDSCSPPDGDGACYLTCAISADLFAPCRNTITFDGFFACPGGYTETVTTTASVWVDDAATPELDGFPEACGELPDSCNATYIGQPVNVGTGRMYHEMEDLRIEGPLPIAIKRRYDSKSNYVGEMGHRWQLNYLMHIETPCVGQYCSSGTRVFMDAEMRRVFFTRSPTGVGWSPSIEGLTLASVGADPTTPLKVTDKHGTVYEFDQLGRLAKVIDRHLNRLSLDYSNAGELTKIRQELSRPPGIAERQVTLTYSGGRIGTITADDRIVTYTYDGNGDLTDVDLADDTRVVYTYDGNHKLTSAVHGGIALETHEYYGPSDGVTKSGRIKATSSGGRSFSLNYTPPLPSEGHTWHTSVTKAAVTTTYTVDGLTGLVTARENGFGCALCGGDGGESATFAFDGDMRRTDTVDARGIRTHVDYDGAGNVVARQEGIDTTTNPPGPPKRTWNYGYGPFNLLATTTLPISAGDRCTANGQLVTAKVMTNSYSANGSLRQEKVEGCSGDDPLSIITNYSANEQGQVQTIAGPRPGALTTLDYYPVDPSDPDYEITRAGRLRKVTQRVSDTLSLETTYTSYDFFGNVLAMTDPNGVQTVYTYDGRDRVLTTTLPAQGIATENIYDAAGNLHRVRLPNCTDQGPSCPFSIEYVYDPSVNRLSEVHDALGNKIVYIYDGGTGNRVREEYRDSSGVVRKFTNFAYDQNDRLKYVYYTDTNPQNPTDPDGPEVEGAVFTKYHYYPDGTLAWQRDPEGHVVSYMYDTLKRLKTVSQTVAGWPATTAFDYDVQDNLTSVIDPTGLATSYTYDDLGRRRTEVSPDRGARTYLYDEAGNLISTTDARGIATTLTYDPLNRLTAVSYPNPALDGVTYSYDSSSATFGKGRRTGMTDPSGVSVYGYDLRGLLTTETKTMASRSYTTKYTYDKSGNLTQLLYPTEDGLLRQGEANYSYDANGRVSGVTTRTDGEEHSVAGFFSYKPFGPRAHMTFGTPQPMEDLRTYGMRYQLEQWQLGTFALLGGALVNFSHTYDADLNLIARTDSTGDWSNRSFGYDALHRLTQASGPWGSGTLCSGGATYTYDLNGNRTCKGEDSPSHAYPTDAGTNRLGADVPTGNYFVTDYEYDETGNVIQTGSADPICDYVYNQADRLASFSCATGESGSYVYDGDGRRVTKTTGGVTTYFLYDQNGRLLTEIVSGNGPGKDYIYLDGEPLARVDWAVTEVPLGGDVAADTAGTSVHLSWSASGTDPYVVRRKHVVNPSDKTFNGSKVLAVTNNLFHDDPVLSDLNRYDYKVSWKVSSESLFFYHTDYLGTPIAMTYSSGAPAWKAEYRPFGDVFSFPVVTGVTNNLRFPGQYFDSESGLYQNWFRDYDPSLGRYREADPIGLSGGSNLYAYVSGNPLANVDVTGTSWTSNWDLFWDWWLERGDNVRKYGPRDPETQELRDSAAGAYMRDVFRSGQCSDIRLENYGTLRGYWDTGVRPWEWDSTATQVGGFVWSASNAGNGRVLYRAYNTASIYSLFLHIPGLPHRERNPSSPFSFGGNIKQQFEWTERSPCDCSGGAR